MHSEQNGPERRQSFRCAVDDVRQQCALKVGAELLPAKLLEESAEGFGVLIDRPPAIEIGQNAELHTDGGWFSVRVMRVTEVEPPEDAEPSADTAEEAEADAPPVCFRLGLRRMEEIGGWEEPKARFWGDRLLFRPRLWHSRSGMPLAAGVVLATIAVTVPVAMLMWIAVGHQGTSTQIERPAARVNWLTRWIGHDRSSAARSAASGAPAAAEYRPSAGMSVSSSDGAAAREPGGSLSWSHNGGEAEPSPPGEAIPHGLSQTVRRLSGAAAFTLPEVAARLSLTAQQKQRIGEVIEAMAQAVRNLDQQLQGRQRDYIAQQRQQLLDKAQQDALDVLTPTQRQAWEKLTDEAREQERKGSVK
jgi:hypothetical protein